MEETELKALLMLLDDDDTEVATHVEEKIRSIGTGVIPFLEKEWETTFNPIVQDKIEDIVHELQYELLHERFLEWKDSEDQDLLRGLWILATYQYPDIEYDELVAQIEQLYHEVWRHMEEGMTPDDQIRTFNQVFFGDFKFRPNSKNFHAPANSMINAVLESKKGNPISLCSIYMILAKKMGMPISGVNLPNLFILTYKLENRSFYINVFNRGLIFTKEDIDNYLENLQIEKRDMFYEPCTNLDIIIRSLRNLVVSFEKLGDYYKSDEIKTILQKLDDNYFSF